MVAAEVSVLEDAPGFAETTFPNVFPADLVLICYELKIRMPGVMTVGKWKGGIGILVPPTEAVHENALQDGIGLQLKKILENEFVRGHSD